MHQMCVFPQTVKYQFWILETPVLTNYLYITCKYDTLIESKVVLNDPQFLEEV